MFMKIMKNKMVRWLICVGAGGCGLYNGVSCLAVLYQAGRQPYLLSGTERFDFMGYYMIAAMHGAIFVIFAVVLFLFIRRRAA